MRGKLHSLALILGLRYRLFWAQARLRNGKFVLYLIGCLVLLLGFIFMQLGGFGAAAALMRAHASETTTGIVLSSIYLNAILFSVLLGLGMNAVFSDSVLRRYPILRMERFAARQIVSMLEPQWLLIFLLYLGLALGFSLFGTASLWLTVPVSALLTKTNYFAARIIATLIDRLMSTRHGPQILLVIVMGLFMLPSLVLQIDWKNSGILESTLPFLRMIPPFAAAAVFSGDDPFAGLAWALAIFAWDAVLFAVIYRLDRLSLPVQSDYKNLSDASMATESVYDRIASLFNPQIAPLVGKTLRYYVRSPQLRFNYFAALFMIIPFSLLLGRGLDEARSFFVALSYISIAGYLSAGAMTSNSFGFDGSGFRRYYLLPISARTVVQVSAIVPLLLGIPVILVSIALWLAITPVEVNGRMLLWLVSCGFGGLLMFQSLGLWVSLVSPRAIPFKATFGNRLSLGANVLMILGIFIAIYPANVLVHLGMESFLEHWWIGPGILAAGVGFHIVTLSAGARYFSNRRERMLSTIERGC
ncbi:MAG: hypothetical protein P8Z37_10385 [Acidobacteriota bacterium]